MDLIRQYLLANTVIASFFQESIWDALYYVYKKNPLDAELRKWALLQEQDGKLCQAKKIKL